MKINIHFCGTNEDQNIKNKAYIQEILYEKRCMLNFHLMSKPCTSLKACQQCNMKCILFIDICLDSHSWISFAERVKKFNNGSIIILCADSIKFFKAGFKIEAFRYLIYPWNKTELLDLIRDAIQKIQVARKYLVCEKSNIVALDLNKILYFEKLNRKLHAHYISSTTSFSGNIKDLEKDLGTSNFLRCHNSYLVNIEHIKFSTASKVILDNCIEIPISRTYSVNFKQNIEKIIFMQRIAYEMKIN